MFKCLSATGLSEAQAGRDGERSQNRMIKTPMAKHQTDEVAKILAVWRDLGIKDLDGRRASGGFESTGEHLANLRRWEIEWRSRDGS